MEAFKDYSVVTDTPVYETAKQNAINLSDVSDFLSLHLSPYCKSLLIIVLLSASLQLHYRSDYNVNIKGTNTAPAETIDTQRARLANYIQSDVRKRHLFRTGKAPVQLKQLKHVWSCVMLELS